MPAVKANAYGHGAVLIAKELNRLGITAFCVATVTEGAEGLPRIRTTTKQPFRVQLKCGNRDRLPHFSCTLRKVEHTINSLIAKKRQSLVPKEIAICRILYYNGLRIPDSTN